MLEKDKSKLETCLFSPLSIVITILTIFVGLFIIWTRDFSFFYILLFPASYCFGVLMFWKFDTILIDNDEGPKSILRKAANSKNYDEAEKLYKEAIEASGKNDTIKSEAYLGLGHLYSKWGDRDDEAESSYKEAIGASGKNDTIKSEAWSGLLNIYVKQGRKDEANDMRYNLKNLAIPKGHIVLLLDTSSSMEGSKLDDLKTGVLQVLNPKNRPDLERKIGLITFGGIARIVFDIEELGKIYNQMREEILKARSGGTTPLKEAIIKADGLLNESNQEIPPNAIKSFLSRFGRFLGFNTCNTPEFKSLSDEYNIVIITDGEPTGPDGHGSYILQNEILNYVNTMRQRKRIKLICVGVGDDVNDIFLKKLADTYIFVSNTERLKEIFLA